LKILKGELKIEGFVELKKINLSYNELTELTIVNCPNLKVVNCSSNNLTKLEIRNCSQLSSLWCLDNPLEKLYLDGVTDPDWKKAQEELKDCLIKDKKGYDLLAWKKLQNILETPNPGETDSFTSPPNSTTSLINNGNNDSILPSSSASNYSVSTESTGILGENY